MRRERRKGVILRLLGTHEEFGRLSCYLLLLSQIFFILLNGNGRGIQVVEPRKLYDVREEVYRNNNLPRLGDT
jgi:hypothetical protein